MKKVLLTMVVALMSTVNVSAQLKSRYDTENYKRGVELVEEGKLDEGVKLLEAELKEHPKNPFTNFFITTVYLKLEQYDKAMASVDKALKYLPKRHREVRGFAYALKATIYCYSKKWKEAAEQLTLSLSVFPEEEYEHRAVAHRQRGEIYYSMKLDELGEQDFKKAEELKALARTKQKKG